MKKKEIKPKDIWNKERKIKLKDFIDKQIKKKKIMKIIESKELMNQISYPVGEFVEKNMHKIGILSKEIIKELKPGDAVELLCMGSSGAIIASFISMELISKGFSTSIAHIKKDNESSHSGPVNVKLSGVKLIIVDDFVCTGSTVNRIYDKLCKYAEEKVDIYMLAVSGDLDIGLLDFSPEILICGEIMKSISIKQ